MAWDGWYEMDGVEFINVSRTEAYAKGAGLNWFRPVFKNDSLAEVLGDAAYTNVVTDVAPWYDPNNPHSEEFFGVYPLDVSASSDSTISMTPIESVGDGGVVPLIRNTTKALVFNTVLIASSQAGADFGLQWLKTVLLGSGEGCFGYNLAFFAFKPVLGDSGACAPGTENYSDAAALVQRARRTLRRVKPTVGAQVINRHSTSNSGAAWNVQFTLTAGLPFEHGDPVPLIEGFVDPAKGGNPWVGGTAPAGGSVVNTPYSVTDEDCTDPGFQPIYDPLYPGVMAPPPPPGIQWNATTPPTVWNRRRFTIPGQFVPRTGRVEPVFTLRTNTVEARNIRVRIYPDPNATGDMDPLDTCNFVADFVVTYQPAETSMYLDTPNRAIYIESEAIPRRRADSLVTDSVGEMFRWPDLGNGIPYVVALDTPAGETTPYLDLSLVWKSH